MLSFFFFSSRRRHTRSKRDWSSDVCSSDLADRPATPAGRIMRRCVPWNDWIRTVEIEPSLYAADFAHLGEQIDVLLRAGARVFHFDTGDGHFVPPVTIGPIVLESSADQL